jgi:hypothetical protein
VLRARKAGLNEAGAVCGARELFAAIPTARPFPQDQFVLDDAAKPLNRPGFQVIIAWMRVVSSLVLDLAARLTRR